MNQMFNGASAFNQDISGWDVGRVSIMYQMFKNANDFTRNLEAWDVDSKVFKVEMFTGSGVSIEAGNLPCWYDDTQAKCTKTENFGYNLTGDK